MATFIALYRGQTISSAKIVATSADPTLVADIAARLLKRGIGHGENDGEQEDQVLVSIERGQRSALRLIRREAEESSNAAS